MADGLKLTDAQRAGIERTDLSMALTSGAGCGKTFVLSRRYVKILHDDGRPDAPTRVVAVTFTEKAALEMRQRVAAVLTAQLRETADPDRRALLAEWLSRIPEARISTIHGFCSSLLRAHAVEMALDPSFGVLADEFRYRSMLRRAVDDALRGALAEPSAAHVELADAFVYGRLVEMLTAAVEERWRWSRDDYAEASAILERWEKQAAVAMDARWDAFATEELRRQVEALRAAVCDDPTDKLAAQIAEQAPILLELLDRPASRTAATLGRLEKPGSRGSAKAWGGKETMLAVRRQFADLIGRFQAMERYTGRLNDADRLAARCLVTLTEMAADAIARFDRAKREAGRLDYVDLLVKARDLLATRPHVRRRVAEGIRHLLIDEFQDTDALQSRLLMLAVDAVEATPPPGRVFFVGDAKQSIYRFRGADVEVFAALRDAVGSEGRYSLDLNFRTHAAGVRLVNRLFEPLMGEAYEPLVAHRSACPPGAAAEFVLVEAGDTNAERTEAMARGVAGCIAGMLRDGRRRVWDDSAADWRPARPGDIAILMPRLQNTAPYERALRDAGVDYYIVAGTGLFRQSEVYDLCNALRAIDNPLDDVAVLGFLRGGMVGLDDNVLAHVAAAATPPYRARLDDPALLERLGQGDRDALRAAHRVLTRLAAEKDTCGLDALIERLLEATGYEAVLLAQPNGRRRCGNIHRVLAHARSAQAGGATLAAFVDFLSALTIEEIRAEQAATEAEAGDVVRLMTVHKAKGLQFPVVVLPDLNFVPKAAPAVLNVRGAWGMTLRAAGESDDAAIESKAWQLAGDLERDRERAEDIRQLYVAVTRHQDHIVFVGACEMTDGGLGCRHSALNHLDTALNLSDALPDGQIDLGEGHAASVRRIEPPRLAAAASRSRLEALLARTTGPDALAAALTPRQVRPVGQSFVHLAATPVKTVERLAVTSLVELDHCPRAFRWHHELRAPAHLPSGAPGGEDGPGGGDGRLDAATAGTVFHRCMELLDVNDPQTPEALVARALADEGVTADAGPLAATLGSMLAALRGHDLWATLAGARRRLAELPFVTRIGPVEVEGIIDLLVETADGRWCVIDYKSDRVTAATAARRAGHYGLQMAVYASAAARRLGLADGKVSAALYFLRPALACPVDVAAMNAAEVERRVTHLADRLAACRAEDRWPGREDGDCASCRFVRLCHRKSVVSDPPARYS
ncbi:MAG: UvrD-helicase domain-containing protein [Planctomycetes bacterium]|nr:UvrD-helicase domain-containing protein [Planctomycetota bacterium]